MQPVTKDIRLYDRQNPFKLDNGKLLKEVDVAYQSYGTLNSDGTNVILTVFMPLPGNSHAAGIVTDDEIRASKFWLLCTYNKMFVNKPGVVG